MPAVAKCDGLQHFIYHAVGLCGPTETQQLPRLTRIQETCYGPAKEERAALRTDGACSYIARSAEATLSAQRILLKPNTTCNIRNFTLAHALPDSKLQVHHCLYGCAASCSDILANASSHLVCEACSS